MLKSAVGSAALLAIALLSARAVRAAPGHVFLPVVNVTSPGNLDGCAMGDLDKDGHPDVAAVGGTSTGPMTVYVFHNDGSGALSNTAAYPIGGAFGAGIGHSIGIGDFNGDGRPDIVSGNYGGIALFLQTASGSFSPMSVIKSADYDLLRVGDLNNDGKPDVVAVTWLSNTVSVFLQTASGLGAPKVYNVQHNGREDLDLGDVNGDGLTDIVLTSGQQLTNSVAVLLQQAAGGFAPVQYYDSATNETSEAVAVGDVTRDGRDDIITPLGTSNRLAVFPQTSQGTLGAPKLYDFGFSLGEPLDIVDLTGDGHGDVLAGGGAPYLSQPDGSFVAAPGGIVYPAGVHSTCLGDLDGDGKTDSVVTGSVLYVLYGTRTDLSLSVKDNPDPVLSTNDVTFTATVTNNGPDDATKVKLTIQPPATFSLDTLTPSQGSCSDPSCNLGKLAVGDSATVTITANTSDAGTQSTTFSVDAYNYDTDDSNNTQVETTTVAPAADLNIILMSTYNKSGAIDGVSATIENKGPDPAADTKLVVTLPAGVSYVSSDGSCQQSGAQVACSLGTVPIVDAFSGQAPQVQLVLGGSGTIDAKVSATTGDPDPSNNETTLAFGSVTSGTGGSPGSIPPGAGAPLPGSSGGCGCELAGRRTTNPFLLLLFAAGLLVRRRRTRP